jgi:hypothetical protein
MLELVTLLQRWSTRRRGERTGQPVLRRSSRQLLEDSYWLARVCALAFVRVVEIEHDLVHLATTVALDDVPRRVRCTAA